MNKQITPAVSPAMLLLWLFFLALASSLTSCKDECETTVSYIEMEPVLMQVQEIRDGLATEPARDLEVPGKIYVQGNYLFINEHKKGIHVLDNSNPAAPRKLSFISIPGSVDLAVRGNTLYTDSYMDLVVFDISNPENIVPVRRVEDVFNNMYGLSASSTGGNRVVVDYKEKIITRKMSSDCNSTGGTFWPNSFSGRLNMDLAQFSSPARSDAGGAAGVGGSMARFTIYDNYLYTVDNTQLQLFNITSPSNPTYHGKVYLNWGIETIFPYRDKLFIGSTTGMHIYDNADPSHPKLLSTYQHVNSCDPVVVEGDFAYVTLRSGTECAGFTNQMDVLNISDLRNPKLIKTYPMQNPHGLGIDQSTLFLCEGSHGLKVFNIQDKLKIDKNLLAHFKTMDAFDVIPLNGVLMLIGKDGLYQYDYSNPKSLKLLSKIPVVQKK
jgi:hypothetical protein